MIDITDMTVAQARSALKSLMEEYDLTLEEPTEEEQVFNEEVQAGYIISSDPAENEPLKRGDTIHIVVSKGPELEEFPVPPFVGQNINDVRKLLVDTYPLTCTDADIEWMDSDEPEGTILWQSIDGYSTAKEGDTIKF